MRLEHVEFRACLGSIRKHSRVTSQVQAPAPPSLQAERQGNSSPAVNSQTRTAPQESRAWLLVDVEWISGLFHLTHKVVTPETESEGKQSPF